MDINFISSCWPTIGDEITIVDYSESFATNNLTINPNGSKTDGRTGKQQLKGKLDVSGTNVRFVFTDSTRGNGGAVPVFDDVKMKDYGRGYTDGSVQTGGTETTINNLIEIYIMIIKFIHFSIQHLTLLLSWIK